MGETGTRPGCSRPVLRLRNSSTNEIFREAKGTPRSTKFQISHGLVPLYSIYEAGLIK